MIKIKVFLGVDHQGVKYKDDIVNYLNSNGIAIEVSQVNNTPTDDYPDFAFKVGKSVVQKESNYGILICTTGIGISIAANKVKNVRCAHVSNPLDAKATRLDNDANVLAFSSKLDFEQIKEIIKNFINTEFSNEERHLRRIEKIRKYENGEYNEL